MTDEEKMIWMFKEIHGNVSGSCSLETITNDSNGDDRVCVIKDGNLCWEVTKTELVFDYLTKHLD